ncbi:MAG: N-acetyl sugar amidotransferase [Acidobacteria bacterium]|nr:N-acetyl sugar amidotransferase [Acidobacteriota bacterium]
MTKPRSYQLCTRCVMDTSDLEIIFNDRGHCNHCTEFLAARARYGYDEQGQHNFERMIDIVKAAGRGKPYDCVVGVSGGLDSSYLAHLVVERGLRPIAVHMDNGWDSMEAVLNIRNITNKLEIAYESYVLDWTEFSDLQLAFLRASVPEAETPTDVAIPAAIHEIAAKFGIKFILSAGNLTTEGILPKSWHYKAKDMTYFNHIQKTFGNRGRRAFATFDYRAEIYFKFVKGIRTLYPLNFLPYSPKDAISELTDRFGYRYSGRKHHESRYTRFIQSYYLFEKFGIDYRRATFSSQIVSGQLEREDALEQLKLKPYTEDQVTDDKEYVSKKLSISIDELEAIIDSPPKWYWDYPNDDRRLQFMYGVYRKLFGRGVS